ncbi:MAG: ChbG/HpnK family deacetylase [Victivallales bacterium]|nr:ChbG/HpnK family deacetylase [Victivallales bacterium]
MAVIINADDVGISPGCDAAVAKAVELGGVNSVSFFANGQYLDEALARLPAPLQLNFGVHLTLSYGPALSGKSSLAPNGFLKNSYLRLFLFSIISERFRSEVELEFECQIRHLLAKGRTISHLDSHHHVHMIPPLFKITVKLAEKYEINRIRRSCDENLLFSLFAHGFPWRLSFAGLAKFALMKIFGLFISRRKGRRVRFASMLYSGGIAARMIEKITGRGKSTEIMVHPGIPELDNESKFHNEMEKGYWLSEDRRLEFEACLESAKQPPNSKEDEQDN